MIHIFVFCPHAQMQYALAMNYLYVVNQSIDVRACVRAVAPVRAGK